jgi:hypothetical protein
MNRVGLKFGPRPGTTGSVEQPKWPDRPMPAACDAPAKHDHHTGDRCGSVANIGFVAPPVGEVGGARLRGARGNS